MFNVTRPADTPECLARGQYNEKGVVDALIPMFHGKCYLCEQDELSDPEIEHFEPHQGDEEKKYDWRNLFLSCSRCNSIKSITHRELLDCSNPELDVFRAIKCLMPSTPDGKIEVTSCLPDNDCADRTARLIDLCYNSENTPLRGVTRSVLVEKLFSHYTEFLTYRLKIRDKRSGENEKSNAKERLTSMLKVEFPFSVFWRWHILSDTFLRKEMENEINF